MLVDQIFYKMEIDPTPCIIGLAASDPIAYRL